MGAHYRQNVHRRRNGQQQIRRFAGNIGPDGPQDAGIYGTSAWLRDRPRIEQVSADALRLNQGTIYPALLRLEQRGWIKSEWGTSETNRRAKFYTLSRIGRKQMEMETENWERIAATMARFLAPSH